MLATSSRTTPFGWLRGLLYIWFGWLTVLPWASAPVTPRRAVQTHAPTAHMRAQAHLRNLDQRLYPIPASRAHLYARAADGEF